MRANQRWQSTSMQLDRFRCAPIQAIENRKLKIIQQIRITHSWWIKNQESTWTESVITRYWLTINSFVLDLDDRIYQANLYHLYDVVMFLDEFERAASEKIKLFSAY